MSEFLAGLGIVFCLLWSMVLATAATTTKDTRTRILQLAFAVGLLAFITFVLLPLVDNVSA